MNIGVLTFHRALNYGALLQAYALCKTLNAIEGNQCELIDYRCDEIENCYKLFVVFGKVNPKNLLISVLSARSRVMKRKKFQRFLEEQQILSQKVYHKSDIGQTEAIYDVLVTGSDQVFNDSCAGFDGTYFLDFLRDDSKKTSYAASFGFTKIPDALHEAYRERLKGFREISMREQTGVDIVQELLQRKASIHIDPTFLLRKDKWEQLAVKPKEKKYILIYLLQPSDTIFTFVQMLSHKTGAVPILMHLHFMKNNGIKQIVTAGPEEFLGYFRYADYIVTNSFHGTAFSINLHKKFFVEYQAGKPAGNTRQQNLLRSVGLEDRVIEEPFFASQIVNCDRKIAYDHVEEILEQERQKSMEYLKQL